MSGKVVKSICSIFMSLLIALGYLIYVTAGNMPAVDSLKEWAVTILIFVAIAVGAYVVFHILFMVVYTMVVTAKNDGKTDKEVEGIVSNSFCEDEMDKVISRISGRAETIAVGIGFLAMLIALACGAAAAIGLHIAVGAFFLGGVTQEIVSIILNVRGVK